VELGNEKTHIETAFKIGAKGYLCETASEEEIKQMLLAISQGNILTYRQQEILKLIAQGESAKEIARELQISLNTVECHCKYLSNS